MAAQVLEVLHTRSELVQHLKTATSSGIVPPSLEVLSTPSMALHCAPSTMWYPTIQLFMMVEQATQSLATYISSAAYWRETLLDGTEGLGPEWDSAAVRL
jgi:hypothetical protein